MPINRSPRKSSKPPTKHPPDRGAGPPNGWFYRILLLPTIAVYAQILTFDFVNYDDPEYVAPGHGVGWALTSGEAANWIPLTRLSHLLDLQLFGLHTGLHHLTNLLFHALATLLLFAFLNSATRAPWPSAFVAFVFALHPLHVESVAWVSERKDVLSACLCFLTLYLYVRYTQQPSARGYLAVLCAFALGLMAKPMLVSLPFVLLLLDCWPLRRSGAIREKLPLFALSAASAIAAFLVQQSSRAVKPFPIGTRAANALISYCIYIEKFFWPTGLAVFYPYPRAVSIASAILSGLILVAVSILVLQKRRTRPYLLTGWFWFVGTLVPVIGFVQVGAQARADRYTYIPYVGITIMLAWTALDIVKRWPQSKRVVEALAIAACLGCAIVTFVQLQYWKNSESLFARALQVTTDNYVAQHNLGLAIADSPGRLPEAIAHYRAALAVQPESVEARSDLGSALAKNGQFQQGIAEYRTALEIAPDCAICRKNLTVAEAQWAQELFENGVKLQKSGQAQQAIQQFQAALRLAPENAEAHNNLGVALASAGRTADAVPEFQAALRLRPDYSDAQYNLTAALSQLRR
jgi:protein O-mannosyl-transferase